MQIYDQSLLLNRKGDGASPYIDLVFGFLYSPYIMKESLNITENEQYSPGNELWKMNKYYLGHPVYRYAWLIMALFIFFVSWLLFFPEIPKILISQNSDFFEKVILTASFLFFSIMFILLPALGFHEFISYIIFFEDRIILFHLFRKKTIMLNEVKYFRFTSLTSPGYMFNLIIPDRNEIKISASSGKVRSRLFDVLKDKERIQFGKAYR